MPTDTPMPRNLRDGKVILFEGRQWEALKAYALNDIVVPTEYNGCAYKCTTAGTSNAAEPKWPKSSTVSDGTAVFTTQAVKNLELPYIDEGGLKADNDKAMIEIMHRGAIAGRREGDESHVQLSAEFRLTHYQSDTNETPTLADVLLGQGEADNWASARPAEEPHAVNVLFKILHAADSEYECLQYPGFTPTKEPLPSEGAEADTITLEGKAFCRRPTAWRESTT